MPIETFLETVSRQLNAVKQARILYAAKLSPDFNSFQYILPDELCLSKILADLLDPRGKHSQGNSFLLSFLRMSGLESWLSEKPPTIETEAAITHIERNNRRIDIKITWDNQVIAIENKPWALDQPNQIRDYIEEISNYNDWHFIYISGWGQDPEPNSISENDLIEYKKAGKITVISYSNLISWLTDCIGMCSSERFRWFLGEFKLYLLEKFKGEKDMQERHLVIEQTFRTKDNLEAALEVSKAMIEIKDSLLNKLHEQLKNIIQELKYPWTIEWNPNSESRYTGFKFIFLPNQNQQYIMRFSFEQKNLNSLIFGIAKQNDKGPNNTDIFNIMEKVDLGSGRGRYTQYWPWYVLVQDDLQNWMISNKPWLKILDGSLAQDFMKMVKLCYDTFVNDNALQLLKG